MAAKPKEGAPYGNKNAAKGVPQRTVMPLSVRYEQIEAIRLQLELQERRIVEDHEVLDKIRRACYATIQTMADQASRNNIEALII